MKVQITGASNFVDRMFEAAGPHQWARELLQNSIEAGATRVEFGVEWQAVQLLGAYRRTVVDDGAGMDAARLLAFFSTLGASSKDVGGIHDNFGIGAKIACLPWNPQGLVVVSYKDGVGSMIWIVLDKEQEEYELVEFDTPSGKRVVIPPMVVDGIDWAALRPDWLQDHGTVVVLLGSKEAPNTLTSQGAGIRHLSHYLNSRYVDLSGIDVRVMEPRSENPSRWPKSRVDQDARMQMRRIHGALKYAQTDPEFSGGGLAGSGEVQLDHGRATAKWFLWSGDRKQLHTYAQESGYIALVYNGEIYFLSSSKVHYRWFGIVEAAVQHAVTIFIEPNRYTPGPLGYGVYPDQSRNRLLFAGDGERGSDPPLSKWAYEFAEKMPVEIREAITAARGSDATGVISEEYRERLMERFGSRWHAPSGIRQDRSGSSSSTGGAEPTTPTRKPREAEEGEPEEEPEEDQDPTRKKAIPSDPEGHPRSRDPGHHALKNQPIDIPRYRYAHRDEFLEPWHLALWSPHDEGGPTVVINVDSPILQEIVEYRQAMYPEIYAEEIASEVRKIFGEIATCKIAHSQRLAKLIPEEQLDADYRNERALTISLMGLIAEESLISQRLKARFKKSPETKEPRPQQTQKEE